VDRLPSSLDPITPRLSAPCACWPGYTF